MNSNVRKKFSFIIQQIYLLKCGNAIKLNGDFFSKLKLYITFYDKSTSTMNFKVPIYDSEQNFTKYSLPLKQYFKFRNGGNNLITF
jgi:hypothetical protein